VAAAWEEAANETTRRNDVARIAQDIRFSYGKTAGRKKGTAGVMQYMGLLSFLNVGGGSRFVVTPGNGEF